MLVAYEREGTKEQDGFEAQNATRAIVPNNNSVFAECNGSHRARATDLSCATCSNKTSEAPQAASLAVNTAAAVAA